MIADDVNSLLRRAVALHERGQVSQAEALYRQVISLDRDHVDALNLLGLLCIQMERPAEAESLLRRALALDPNFSEAHNHLGGALQKQGRIDDAIACYQTALSLKGDNLAAWNNLADAYLQANRLDEALAAIAAPLAAGFSQSSSILNNIGVALTRVARFTDAAMCYQRAVEAQPDFAAGYKNLGEILRELGRHEDAVAAFRRALELEPHRADVHSLLLFTLQVHPSISNQVLYAEHQAYDRQHAAPLSGSIRPHGNDRSPDRPLRIGYVSPDFRDHAIAFFIEPILANRDRRQFQDVCYHCVDYQDEVTNRLKNQSDLWRELHGVSDERAAEMIREDRIDILVDLATHSKGNRLAIFARKPAPVQATYLGYAGTTGLSAIDYRLTDAIIDPPGMTEQFHSEQLLRLPRTFWCFRPWGQSPPVSELPYNKNGRITFGSANALTKINSLVLEQWAKVLRAVPNAELHVKARGFEDLAIRRDLAYAFQQLGIDPARLQLHSWSDLAGYLEFFNRIDVALDVFPFAGGTTTCHGLWMGVPVITFAQERSVSRVGASILANIGLADLIANTSEDYVRLATNLAQNPDRLMHLRRTMRDRMEHSPLRDEAGFARELECAYRQIWKKWCAANTSPK